MSKTAQIFSLLQFGCLIHDSVAKAPVGAKDNGIDSALSAATIKGSSMPSQIDQLSLMARTFLFYKFSVKHSVSIDK